MSEYRNFTLHEAKSGHIFDKSQRIMNGRKVNISGNELIRRFEFGLRDHKGGHILSKNFETLNFLSINAIDGNEKSGKYFYAENTDLHQSLDLEIVSNIRLLLVQGLNLPPPPLTPKIGILTF